MFSNDLIRSLVTSSDETNLKLSNKDWHLVLEANKGFAVSPELWRGNAHWGRYLVNRVGGKKAQLDFTDSLELCCGNGFLYFSFKDMFAFGERSHFIDLSATQCAGFERRCASSGVSTPHIICDDIGSLPFDDGSLGMVYGNSFLHHLPDVGLYLKEACRVLRPGGRFVAFHEPTASAPFLESFPRTLFRRVDNGSLTDIWLIRPDVITRLLHQCGYRHVKVYPAGLAASLVVTPWQLVLDKLGLPYQCDRLPDLLSLFGKLDGLLPPPVAVRYSPSIAVVAVK